MVYFMRFLLSIGLLTSLCGMGIRHDVAEEEYKKLGSNAGKYAAGENYPDFSAVCAVIETIDGEAEIVGSGTLIADRYIITAAHCVIEPSRAKRILKNLSVRFGADSQKNYTSYQIKTIHLPKPVKSGFYKPFGEDNHKFTEAQDIDSHFHDIAIIELEKQVKGIKALPLNLDHTPKLKQRLFISGYGETGDGTMKNESKFESARFRHAGENTLDRIQTTQPGNNKKAGGMLLFDFDNGTHTRNSLQIQANQSKIEEFGKGTSEVKPLPLEASSYPGDSGGPAIMKIEGQWKVVGVSSYGTGYPVNGKNSTLQYGEIVYYTYLKAHAKWIKKILALQPN